MPEVFKPSREIIVPARSCELRVMPFLLPYIADGTKTIEVRTASPYILKIGVGTQILFNGQVTRYVGLVRPYSDFDAMIADNTLDINRIFPNITPQRLLTELRRIYPSQKEHAGIRAFDLTEIEIPFPS